MNICSYIKLKTRFNIKDIYSMMLEWVYEYLFKIYLSFLLERAMTKPSLARIRKELLSNVKGDILEIGFGTGLNLKYYPSHIKEITVIDINDELGKKAQSRINKSSIKVNYKN